MEFRVLVVVVVVVMLHFLGTPGQVLVMLHCLIALKVIIIGLATLGRQEQCGKQI